MLRQKFLFTLQTYVFDRHHVHITTDDAETIITFTDNKHLNGWFDENDNIKIDDFTWLINCFMDAVEISRKYEIKRQQHT